MAYTPINAQKTTVSGEVYVETTGQAGGAGAGNNVSNNGNVMLNIRNTGANTPNIVVERNGLFKGVGFDGDTTIAMGASETKIAGPFDPEIYGTTLQWNFTGSNEIDLEVAAIVPLNA